MSVLAYEQEYQQVLQELSSVQVEDAQVNALRFGNDARSRNKHFQQYWVSMYLRYLSVARRLNVLMENELQPQKLHDLRTMLNSCIGRMLEAKEAVVKNCGDYLALDDLLLDMKLRPEQITVPVPRYILEDRGDELTRRRQYIRSLQAHYMDTEPDAPVSQALQQPRARSDPSKALPLSVSAKPAANEAGGAAAGDAVPEESEEPLPFDEAVRLIQACERGRQARQRIAFQMLLYKQQQYAAIHGKEFNTVTGKDKAATLVQKVVLGYLERKRAAERYKKEKAFLGMTANADTFNDDERLAAELRAQDRHSRQLMNQSELRQKTVELESRIKTKEGPKTMEVMLDEVLMRMAYARMESKDTNGAMVELPSAEEGGSLKFLGRMPQPAAAAASPSAPSGKQTKSSPRGKKASKGGGGADGAAAADGGGDAGGGGGAAAGAAGPRSASASSARRKSSRGGKEDESLAPAMPPSAFWSPMQEGAERYESIWRPMFEHKYGEGGDLDRKADEDELREQLLSGPRGIMSELRSTVDQLIWMEAANLKAKLQAEADAKKKGKKGKRKAKREPKVKKPKLKDPTKGVDLEASMNAAIHENKLQLPPKGVVLHHFIGDENLLASPLDKALRTQAPDEDVRKKWLKILRNWNEDVEKAMGMPQAEMEALFEAYAKQTSWLREPSAAEIRRAVTEYAVLPLGSQVIHDLAPCSKALLFYGLHGTGKTMMSYALCNEAGANFFNLSPANFPTTKGLAKTIQLLFYVARMKGPSVIYIDGIEKIFPGKKIKGLPGPPNAGGKKKAKKKKDPLLARGKKMKKELLKGLSSILPHERVLLVACSAEPWLLDANAAALHFPHAVYFPLPNYATRLALLRHFTRRCLSGASSAETEDSGNGNGNGNKITSAAAVGLSIATALEVPGDMCADGYQQLAVLTEGFTTEQLRFLVERSLAGGKVQRAMQHALEPNDFLHVLAAMRAPAEWERQLMDYFQNQLPFHMRRANAIEDFKETEEELKKRGRNNGNKKPKAKSGAASA